MPITTASSLPPYAADAVCCTAITAPSISASCSQRHATRVNITTRDCSVTRSTVSTRLEYTSIGVITSAIQNTGECPSPVT